MVAWAVPPLGLAYLAATLSEAGHDVTVVDGFRREKDAQMWIVEDKMKRAEGPMEPEPERTPDTPPLCRRPSRRRGVHGLRPLGHAGPR